MSHPARRLLWPGLMTAVMLVILLGLGTWQMQRRDWKLALLASIDAAEAAPAIPVPASPANFAPPPFAKVVLNASLPPGAPTGLYGAEVRGVAGTARMGGRLLTVLHPDQGPPILADLGWVPSDAIPTLPPGPMRVVGYVRPPDTKGWAAAKDDPVARRFYTLNPAAIGPALGEPALAPYILVALGSAGSPDPARSLPRPKNDHLTYALTWYGLAAALAAVFLVYARKVFRA